MIQKNINKLDFNQIKLNLASYCTTYLAKDLSNNLSPIFNKSVVDTLLNETSEAYNFIVKYGNPPLSDFPNIDIVLKKLESHITLSAKELLEMAHILKISRELLEYFKSQDFSNYLTIYFNMLYSNLSIESSIFDAIIDENNISDNASPTLLSLRHKKRTLENTIKDKLQSYIHSNTYSKFLMEPIITIKNNRYVIPVKIEYKDKIKGFIHDISFSGSTIFIEPISIFDLNNNLSNIKLEENMEIEKILQALSSKLYPNIIEISDSIKNIGIIDFIFAKSKYSLSIDGIKPTLNDNKIIELFSARNPLINKDSIVPIDIFIGKNFNTLIITGPNTGGKTVALKTIGLLCLMCYCGIFIPANEQSNIFVFDNIFADIGDEQSIYESLSTFSSHILNIIEIINSSTENSLILLDELGAGTDPIQGANLAISILEYFFNLHCRTVATTHYSELKNYALITDGFENASSDFDLENLKPTYKLLIGVPGQSNAFEISKKLGIPTSILERANNLMTTDNVNIEKILKNIYITKNNIESEKEQISKELNNIILLKNSLEKNNSEITMQEKALIDAAKTKASQILLEAKDNADSLIKELNELYNNNSKDSLKLANQLRNEFNNQIKSNIITNKEIDVQDLKNSILKNSKSNLQSSSNNKNRTPFKSSSINSKINVIGQNVDQAIEIIDKYLDDCALANITSVQIIHGKGTGKLRNGIHQFLKSHPAVKTFRLGTLGEGDLGVTIVELKN